MKKIFKFLAYVVGGLIVLLAVFLLSVYVVNKVALKQDLKKIQPYGEFVKVEGHQLNLVITGEGAETVVLLPGFLTASPVLDFSQLTRELAKTKRVVVVEPLGYGLSDDTATPRTLANVTQEIHSALQAAGITKFTLMAHSLGGIYSLAYLNQYPAEVQAFVGIDSSVPNQPGGEDNSGEALKLLAQSGLYRVLTKLTPELSGYPADLSAAQKNQYRLIALKNLGNQAAVSESAEMGNNFKAAQKLSYPKDLPVLNLIASASVKDPENWVALHEEMLVGLKNQKLEVLTGEHYLHHTQAKKIAALYDQFMTNLK